MVGVIDVGGGLRGVYAAGVLDYCMKNNIQFDRCYGVSAGSANVSTYIAGQKGRCYQFYVNYSFRSQYMGWKNFFKTRNFINLDYIYSTLSNHDGEYPLDWPAIQASDKTLTIVATDADTGLPVYFDKSDMHQDYYNCIKASCCVPVINRPYPLGGRRYFDGGISDPIPIRKALEDGCDKVVVILTRPKDFMRSPKTDKKMAKRLYHLYPKASKDMATRAEVYNEELDFCKKLEKEGRVLIVAPVSNEGMHTLTRDKDALIRLYHRGTDDGSMIASFLQTEVKPLQQDDMGGL